MTATQAPDTLRLVPAEPTIDMVDAGMAAPMSDERKAATDTLTRQIYTVRDIYRAMLSASPAVQPAAGREEIARLRAAAEQKCDCSVCDGEGQVQRYDPPYGLRKCGGCDGTGERYVLPSQLREDILAAISTPAQASGEPVAWRYRWKPTPRSQPGEWREPTNIRWGEEDRTGFEEQPLYAHPPAQASESGGERDYPAEFEAWWATYKHRNRDVAEYPVKKQIAFDAFYFAALSAPQAAPGD